MKISDAKIVFSGVKSTYFVRGKDGCLFEEAKAVFKNEGDAEVHAYLKASATSKDGRDFNLSVVTDVVLPCGENEIAILVPDTNKVLKPGYDSVLTLALYEDEKCETEPIAVHTEEHWARTRHWQFYMSQSMHTDIGYTNYQGQLPALYTSFIDTVKKFMKDSDMRDTDIEKYKYAIESGWVMGEGYMTQANAEEIKEVTELIGKGRMEIGAGQFNYTMECFSTEELARAAYYTNRYLVDKLGIAQSRVERMFDNPAFTKSYVDVANSAGIKYGYHSMNGDRSPYWKKKEYDVFYLKGNVPGNKLLIFNGHSYGENYGFSSPHGSAYNSDVENCTDNAISCIDRLLGEILTLEGRRRYPYDKFPMQLVPFGDNKAPDDMQVKVINSVNKRFADEGYAYPRLKTAFPTEFFEDVEAEYSEMIPSEDGTEENWWNDGWGTTAYESGLNKLAGNTIPAAETAASFAAEMGTKYPYNALSEAMYRNLVYDEHTWGNWAYDNSHMYHSQWEWKRSYAFGAKVLADKCLKESVEALAGGAVEKSEGKSIYVYNGLNWVRNDAVHVELTEDFPEFFEIKYGGESVPYEVKDGVLSFVAKDVPAMGYKVYSVEKVDTSKASCETVVNVNSIENEFYKVVFASDGTIASITDKKANREVVDTGAVEKFNQYRYYDDHGIPFSNMNFPFDEDKWTLHTPETAEVILTKNDVCETARVTTSTFRNPKITQTVKLYRGIPRIDIVNEVVKGALPSLQTIEEAYYTFPFRTEGKHEIRYDIPLGNMVEGKQTYGTSHDWYTVCKWSGVRDTETGYNMVLASPNTALVEFGERRTGKWSFDYVSEKPYIYSYVFNNMWQTNFQGDQPGYADFRYSISTNSCGEDMSENNRFGWESVTPMQAAVVSGSAKAESGSYIKIGSDHVQLTTMKPAEANGEGMILRFAEIAGKAVSGVKVSLGKAADVTETDIIENDLPGNALSEEDFVFDIPAYGFKTFRVRYHEYAPAKVNITSVCSTKESTRSENLVIKSDTEASSIFAGGYESDCAKDFMNGREWASKGESNPWIKFTWDEPVTVKVLAIASRNNPADLVEKAEVYADGDDTPIAVFTGNPLNSDIENNRIILDKAVTVKELKVQLIGSTDGAQVKNNGLSGFAAYADIPREAELGGTYIKWEDTDGAEFYRIYRGTTPDFVPGCGNYIGSTERTGFYDSQVTSGMKTKYHYSVCAVGKDGIRGEFSDKAATVTVDKLEDKSEHTKPELHAIVREEDRVDLWWTPVKNDLPIKYFKVFRNGEELTLLHKNDHVVSFRDKRIPKEAGKTIVYTVAAVDWNGNETFSEPVTVKLW